MTSIQLAKTIAGVLDAKKAQDVRALKIEDLTIITDYFVIATGTSTTQVKALADEVEYKLGEMGVKPAHVEGYDARNWILLDYNTVIVHIFYPEARSFYDLEHLWADGVPVDLDLEEA